MKHIIGIIPAAGKGTRLSLPYPKELAPVSYKDDRVTTVIESNIRQLSDAGIYDAIIVISREKQMIKDHLGETRYGVHLHYLYQNRMHSREGLTDAVMSTKFAAKDYELCVMLMGDVFFTDMDTTKKLVQQMRNVPDAIAGVSLWSTHEPHRFGIVETEYGKVKRVVDKPEGLEIGTHWGAVAFRNDFWFYMDYEKDTFSAALSHAAKEHVTYVLADGDYRDIGTPKALIEAIVEINS